MASPWPSRDADPSATRQSPSPGASRGIVGPRWAFPKGWRSWTGPIIAAGGRIAISLDDSLLLFTPDLKDPQIRTLTTIKHLAATGMGDLLVATVQDTRRIAPDGSETLLDLTAPFAGKPPAGLLELPNGDLYAWRDSHYAQFDSDGDVRSQGDLGKDFGWSGYHATAIASDGARAHAMALSWSSEDEPSEYYGGFLAISPDGLPLFHKRLEEDRLPTSTGLNLRLIALADAFLLAETGAVCFDRDGHERWRETSTSVRAFVHLAPSTVLYVRDGIRLLRVDLAPAPNRATPELVLELTKADWINDVVADGAGHLFVAERHTVIAVDEQGKVRFRALVPGIQSLLVGEGYLLGIQQPLALVRID